MGVGVGNGAGGTVRCLAEPRPMRQSPGAGFAGEAGAAVCIKETEAGEVCPVLRGTRRRAGLSTDAWRPAQGPAGLPLWALRRPERPRGAAGRPCRGGGDVLPPRGCAACEHSKAPGAQEQGGPLTSPEFLKGTREPVKSK